MGKIEQENEIENLKFDEAGLIPAIVQDVHTKAVLMMAYMNKDSLLQTLQTGLTWFWSRSRQKYWQKGESSGHVQKVRNVYYDCDGDTLLIQVEQVGVACHTGKYSCFFNPLQEKKEYGEHPGDEAASQNPVEFFSTLAAVIRERMANRPEGSYVASLLEEGEEAVARKIGEEALETLRDWASRPDESPWNHLLMVISDLEMPRKDGYTLATEIRRDDALKGAYILLHSSLSGTFNTDMVKQVGADEFLAKFAANELAERVQVRMEQVSA